MRAMFGNFYSFAFVFGFLRPKISSRLKQSTSSGALKEDHLIRILFFFDVFLLRLEFHWCSLAIFHLFLFHLDCPFYGFLVSGRAHKKQPKKKERKIKKSMYGGPEHQREINISIYLVLPLLPGRQLSFLAFFEAGERLSKHVSITIIVELIKIKRNWILCCIPLARLHHHHHPSRMIQLEASR